MVVLKTNVSLAVSDYDNVSHDLQSSKKSQILSCSESGSEEKKCENFLRKKNLQNNKTASSEDEATDTECLYEQYCANKKQTETKIHPNNFKEHKGNFSKNLGVSRIFSNDKNEYEEILVSKINKNRSSTYFENKAHLENKKPESFKNNKHLDSYLNHRNNNESNDNNIFEKNHSIVSDQKVSGFEELKYNSVLDVLSKPNKINENSSFIHENTNTNLENEFQFQKSVSEESVSSEKSLTIKEPLENSKSGFLSTKTELCFSSHTLDLECYSASRKSENVKDTHILPSESENMVIKRHVGDKNTILEATGIDLKNSILILSDEKKRKSNTLENFSVLKRNTKQKFTEEITKELISNSYFKDLQDNINKGPRFLEKEAYISYENEINDITNYDDITKLRNRMKNENFIDDDKKHLRGSKYTEELVENSTSVCIDPNAKNIDSNTNIFLRYNYLINPSDRTEKQEKTSFNHHSVEKSPDKNYVDTILSYKKKSGSLYEKLNNLGQYESENIQDKIKPVSSYIDEYVRKNAIIRYNSDSEKYIENSSNKERKCDLSSNFLSKSHLKPSHFDYIDIVKNKKGDKCDSVSNIAYKNCMSSRNAHAINENMVVKNGGNSSPTKMKGHKNQQYKNYNPLYNKKSENCKKQVFYNDYSSKKSDQKLGIGYNKSHEQDFYRRFSNENEKPSKYNLHSNDFNDDSQNHIKKLVHDNSHLKSDFHKISCVDSKDFCKRDNKKNDNFTYKKSDAENNDVKHIYNQKEADVDPKKIHEKSNVCRKNSVESSYHDNSCDYYKKVLKNTSSHLEFFLDQKCTDFCCTIEEFRIQERRKHDKNLYIIHNSNKHTNKSSFSYDNLSNNNSKTNKSSKQGANENEFKENLNSENLKKIKSIVDNYSNESQGHDKLLENDKKNRTNKTSLDTIRNDSIIHEDIHLNSYKDEKEALQNHFAVTNMSKKCTYDQKKNYYSNENNVLMKKENTYNSQKTEINQQKDKTYKKADLRSEFDYYNVKNSILNDKNLQYSMKKNQSFSEKCDSDQIGKNNILKKDFNKEVGPSKNSQTKPTGEIYHCSYSNDTKNYDQKSFRSDLEREILEKESHKKSYYIEKENRCSWRSSKTENIDKSHIKNTLTENTSPLNNKNKNTVKKDIKYQACRTLLPKTTMENQINPKYHNGIMSRSLKNLLGIPSPDSLAMEDELATDCTSAQSTSPTDLFPGQKNRKKRARTVIVGKKLDALKKLYKKNPFPNTLMREEIAYLLGIKPRTVQIWFQNQRQKTKTTLKDEGKFYGQLIMYRSSKNSDFAFLDLLSDAADIAYHESDVLDRVQKRNRQQK